MKTGMSSEAEQIIRERFGKDTVLALATEENGVLYVRYRYEENQKLPVLSILTQELAPEIAFIHDRMPVIFSERNHGSWLNRNAAPKEVLKLCEKEMAYRSA